MATSAKTKSNPARGPIARKLLASVQYLTRRKVIDIAQWREAKITAENFEKTVVSQEALSKFDPVHGIYVYGQNKISVLAEQLAQLPVLSKLLDAYADAQEEYMPSGPPMSPLTNSYFSCWGFFDSCAGPKRETFGTVAIDLCKLLNVDDGLIAIFEKMQHSRMGVYVFEGRSGKHMLLRELVTNNEIKAISPSGYKGRRGELWLTRVLPPPFSIEKLDYSVAFITPYVLGQFKGKHSFARVTEREWLSFFDRTSQETGLDEKIPAYQRLMKYGLSKNYWNEYIFLAYANHQKDMILLAGFPDISSSLPHSEAYRYS
ncbi:MAG: hypothetical protein ABFS02_09990 [Pseudomonadota bacterium]